MVAANCCIVLHRSITSRGQQGLGADIPRCFIMSRIGVRAFRGGREIPGVMVIRGVGRFYKKQFVPCFWGLLPAVVPSHIGLVSIKVGLTIAFIVAIPSLWREVPYNGWGPLSTDFLTGWNTHRACRPWEWLCPGLPVHVLHAGPAIRLACTAGRGSVCVSTIP